MAEPRGYFFSTPAQWDACEIAGADRAAGGFSPIAPYEPRARLLPSAGGYAPAATRGGEILWRDGAHRLHRVADDGEQRVQDAPAAMGDARRLVATATSFWALGGPGTPLECFEADTLTRRFTIRIPGAKIIDVAGDGCDGVFALAEADGVARVLRIDGAGEVRETLPLARIEAASQLVFLGRANVFVILASAGQRLHWIARAGGAPTRTRECAALHACFVGRRLGRDPAGRAFVSGADKGCVSGRAWIVVLSDGGERVDEVSLAEEVTGLAGTSREMLATTASGLHRFALGAGVPEEAQPVSTRAVTPWLRAPDARGGPRWLRIEVDADLPQGATLEIALAVEGHPDEWRPLGAFHGSAQSVGEFRTPFAAPLQEIADAVLRVALTLHAAAGARLPRIRALAVKYPGEGLLQHLPSIYRRDESRPGAFLRKLVGVLETGTQALDGRIAGLGRHIHRDTGEGAWLDEIARWVDLPWDDTLEVPRKRRLLQAAPRIARERGTRAALEAMLRALLPDGTWRVADDTAERGFAVTGAGARLPAILGGLPGSSARLNVKARVGCLRLSSSATPEDDGARFAGRIRVEISADAGARGAIEPWLTPMLRELVPATARLRLRWLTRAAFLDDRLGDDLVLDDPQPPAARLGASAMDGTSRLPPRGTTLSGRGIEPGSRLQ